MDRASKLFIVGCTGVAFATQAWLLNGAWPGIWWLLGVAVDLVLAAIGRRFVHWSAS